MVRLAPSLALPSILIGSMGAGASDLGALDVDGYAVVEETRVNGAFEGCDFFKRIPLVNGQAFVCSTYSYSYSYMPKVLILQHVDSGQIKVLINGNEYEGTLY